MASPHERIVAGRVNSQIEAQLRSQQHQHIQNIEWSTRASHGAVQRLAEEVEERTKRADERAERAERRQKQALVVAAISCVIALGSLVVAIVALAAS